MSQIRQRRVSEQIQHILSELFLYEVNDPRLSGLTVTRVTIDRELQYAQIYLNALGDDTRQDEVLTAVERANGYLRREVASRMRLRSAPVLQFHWDPTLHHAEEVDSILENLEIPPEEQEES